MTNGAFGLWIGRDGTGHRQKAYMARRFLDQKPTILETLTSPFAVTVSVGGKFLVVSEAHDYLQRQDLDSGSLSTEWVTPEGHRVETFVNLMKGADSVIGFRLVVVPSRNSTIMVHGPARTNLPYSIKLGVEPEPDWTEVKNRGAWRIQATAHKRAVFDLEIATTSKNESTRNYAPCQIVIDGPLDDQQAVNSMVMNLRNGMNANGGTAPFGLSNQKYGSRVFWDSDVWMLPALAILDPERAKSIPEFRLKTAHVAARRYRDWLASTGVKPDGEVGYKFPWEAGPDGDEESTTETVREEHITGSVAFGLKTAAVFGLVDTRKAQTVIDGCAVYLRRRSRLHPDGTRGIHDVISPDEYTRHANNDLYTNALAQWCQDHSGSDLKVAKFKLPHDDTTFLTYEEDALLGYKQAAALLTIWPLQNAECEAQVVPMLKRFVGKTSRDGPAMSKCVEALIQARFSDPEAAYTTWRESWKSHTQTPMMMFTEASRTKHAYFLTGAAGCLDALLYGFVGLRVDDHDPGEKPWKTKLKDGYWLSCTPHLPSAWKSVTLNRIRILEETYDLTVTDQTVRLEPPVALSEE